MEFVCIKASMKCCVQIVYMHKKTIRSKLELMDCACLCWPGTRSLLWLWPSCLFASLIERKVCVLGQSCKKIGFLILFPMAVKPVWDQTLLKPLCCRMMLCWNELEHWTALRVCAPHILHLCPEPAVIPSPRCFHFTFSHISKQRPSAMLVSDQRPAITCSRILQHITLFGIQPLFLQTDNSFGF